MNLTAPRSLGPAAAVIVALMAFAGCAALPDAKQSFMQVGQGTGNGGTAGGGTASGASASQGTTACAAPSSAAAAPIDISTLAPCCTSGTLTGPAHCVPSSDLPPGTPESELASCSGGACVPDSIIKSGGGPLPACKSLSGAAGVCLSVCVPQVAQYATLLPQDVCASDEKCAPCISPLNGQTTGACDIGKSSDTGESCGASSSSIIDGGEGGLTPQPSEAVDAAPVCPYVGPPLFDPSSLPSCDPNGGAHCVPSSLVPAPEASELATCPTGLCVPDSFLVTAGEFIPATCTSLLGAEGRCLDEMIPQVASELSELPVATCKPYERCAPCDDPTSGKSTGACNLSCDPGPKAPATVAQPCCKESGANEGECLPTSSIPAAEQTNLGKDVCTQSPAATLCVPKEMVAPGFTPTACTASSLLTILSGGYSGVCLSKCLNFGAGSGLAVAQGTCDSLHDCAPCTNPLTNAPTGAPGCQGADGGL